MFVLCHLFFIQIITEAIVYLHDMGAVLRAASSYADHLCIGARASSEKVGTAVMTPLVSEYTEYMVLECESCGYKDMTLIPAVCPQCGTRVETPF